jgi:TrkA domain protein
MGLPGVTVVAVVRGESANPAPDGDFKVFPGDTLVVAGAPEKVAKAFQFFRTGEFTKAPAEHSAPPGA